MPNHPTSSNSMDRDRYMLAVLSASRGADYTPIQIQKLFFLLDRKLGDAIGGPYFNFIPYHYGPFDKNVYKALNTLEVVNLVDLKQEGFNNIKKYRLTVDGQKTGEDELNNIESKYRQFIKEINHFVRSLSFQELVSSIYKEYPEMKANSLFEF